MTHYTVVWHQMAQDKLAQIWIEATDRTKVAIAANMIDRQLADDPDVKGVEVARDIYEFTAAPLRVLYEVSEPDRLGRVAGVKRV
jgi:hypothetical protein